MKLKKDLILREVGGNWIVLPLAAETVNFSGILSLNESGAMLWNVLKENCSTDALVQVLLNEYEVSQSQAESDAEEFLNKLIQAGCVEDV